MKIVMELGPKIWTGAIREDRYILPASTWQTCVMHLVSLRLRTDSRNGWSDLMRAHASRLRHLEGTGCWKAVHARGNCSRNLSIRRPGSGAHLAVGGA